ncbi:hypothetical protein M409DRAFT_30378 [Zasmidium cellare ATCC 36951]|uniref:Uncharacterized protein n=1 Tax=Zasmidium cellare ATCC 36951 TaxID=1080233 RepID=A0A6A6BWC7_ZASCE|nr:uncharacterized protein M409DRAFT_30378 [Zasmidium cellare ATCC 36951]KAF2159097.1 hypothetical protein M409DRAFT_30378 [Zasmidium cellare ATCC 36951]
MRFPFRNRADKIRFDMVTPPRAQHEAAYPTTTPAGGESPSAGLSKTLNKLRKSRGSYKLRNEVENSTQRPTRAGLPRSSSTLTLTAMVSPEPDSPEESPASSLYTISPSPSPPIERPAFSLSPIEEVDEESQVEGEDQTNHTTDRAASTPSTEPLTADFGYTLLHDGAGSDGGSAVKTDQNPRIQSSSNEQSSEHGSMVETSLTEIGGEIAELERQYNPRCQMRRAAPEQRRQALRDNPLGGRQRSGLGDRFRRVFR